MSAREVEGWKISAEHVSPFVRAFNAYPTAEVPIDYFTSERKGDRFIDARYPAIVERVSIRYQWEQKDGGYWWGQAGSDIRLISERTGKPYKTEWRKEPIRFHFSPGRDAQIPEYVGALLEATHPRSVVVVTETPA